MKYYAVTGRICGDDEDTLHLVGWHEDREDAVATFRTIMSSTRAISGVDDIGEIFIGAVVCSDREIHEG